MDQYSLLTELDARYSRLLRHAFDISEERSSDNCDKGGDRGERRLHGTCLGGGVGSGGSGGRQSSTTTVGAAGLVELLRSGTPTSDDVGEGVRANIDIGVANEGSIADVAIVTGPRSSGGHVGSNNDVTVSGEANRLIPVGGSVGNTLAIGSTCDGYRCWSTDATRGIWAEGRSHGAGMVAIAHLHAGTPVMVMEFVCRRGVTEADIESVSFVFNGIDVSTGERVEDVATGKGNTCSSLESPTHTSRAGVAAWGSAVSTGRTRTGAT